MGQSKVYNVNPDTLQMSIVDKHRNDKGMGWFLAAIFIVGDMAGGGLVVMPYTLLTSGLWIGIVYLLLGAIISGYTGIQLGHNWTLMQNRWSEYKEHCRNPYPEMAYRALGTKMKHFVQCVLFVTQFGVSTVFLLLASKNISNFLFVFFEISIDFCILILIVALVLLPFIMLKSPMDFWYAAVGATCSTTIAVILLIIGAARDAPFCQSATHYPALRSQDLFLSYGAIMFSYGGHSVFPTIQHDMKKPYHFSRSVLLSYAMIVAMYLPVSVLGYLVYGSSLQDSVIPSIQTIWIQQTVNILITVHVLLTIVILFSPLSQGVEHLVDSSHEFGWSRVLIRSALFLAVIFVAETVPHFGVILDLVGATTVSLLSIMLPPIFYLYLHTAKRKSEERKEKTPEQKEEQEEQVTLKDIRQHTPRTVLFFCICCVVFGLVGGIAATVSAVGQLFHSQLASPCYIRPFLSSSQPSQSSIGSVNCCGIGRNITAPFFNGTCHS